MLTDLIDESMIQELSDIHNGKVIALFLLFAL